MEGKYKGKYRNSSARYSWHDYNEGTYFITICTARREHYFGEITDKNNTPEMHLSKIGKYLEAQIRAVSEHYPYAEIPVWVIMPDHIHLIVNIESVGAMCTSSQRKPMYQSNVSRLKNPPMINEKMQSISKKRGLVTFVISGLKRAVTKYAHENNIDFAWQSRFYDRIIRNQTELKRIASYIENNIVNFLYHR